MELSIIMTFSLSQMPSKYLETSLEDATHSRISLMMEKMNSASEGSAEWVVEDKEANNNNKEDKMILLVALEASEAVLVDLEEDLGALEAALVGLAMTISLVAWAVEWEEACQASLSLPRAHSEVALELSL